MKHRIAAIVSAITVLTLLASTFVYLLPPNVPPPEVVAAGAYGSPEGSAAEEPIALEGTTSLSAFFQ